MMHSVNLLFIGLFKTIKELSSKQEGGISDIRMIFRVESAPGPRRYNNPTADKIGVSIKIALSPQTETLFLDCEV